MNKQANDKVRSLIPAAITILLLICFGFYLYSNFDQYRDLLDLSSSKIWGLLILNVLTPILNGTINYFFYQGVGVRLRCSEGVELAAVNTLANQLPFAGGFVSKALYLKKKHNLDYTHFIGITLALYVCFFASNGVIGLGVLAYWSIFQHTSIPIVLIIGFAGMTASVGIFFVPLPIGWASKKWQRKLISVLNGWQVLKENTRLLAQVVIVQSFLTLSFAARLFLAFQSLSQNVTFGETILFASSTILTQLVSIAPGGLGVREFVVASVASVLGFDMGISVVAVGLDRLVATVVIVLTGTISTYFLSKNIVKDIET